MDKKTRATVFVGPRTKKGWSIFTLMVVSILVTISPCIQFWNRPIVFLGFPLMFWCGIYALVSTLVIINLAYKWGGYIKYEYIK